MAQTPTADSENCPAWAHGFTPAASAASIWPTQEHPYSNARTVEQCDFSLRLRMQILSFSCQGRYPQGQPKERTQWPLQKTPRQACCPGISRRYAQRLRPLGRLERLPCRIPLEGMPGKPLSRSADASVPWEAHSPFCTKRTHLATE